MDISRKKKFLVLTAILAVLLGVLLAATAVPRLSSSKTAATVSTTADLPGRTAASTTPPPAGPSSPHTAAVPGELSSSSSPSPSATPARRPAPPSPLTEARPNSQQDASSNSDLTASAPELALSRHNTPQTAQPLLAGHVRFSSQSADSRPENSGNTSAAPGDPIVLDVPVGARAPVAFFDNQPRPPQQQRVLRDIQETFARNIEEARDQGLSEEEIWRIAKEQADRQYIKFFGFDAYNQLHIKAAIEALEEKRAEAAEAQQNFN